MLGIFDSGLGGLTVAKKIREVLPTKGIMYFGDCARVPYGSKSAATINKFARQDTEWLLAHGATSIVIACHTASAVAGEELQTLFGKKVPVQDVLRPGLDAALAVTRGTIGVIATRASVNSGAHKKYLQKQKPTVRVIARVAPLLVPLAEEGLATRPETMSLLRYYVEPFIRAKVDTLVLGCTHYPLLRRQLEQVLPKDISIIDPADAVAQKIAKTKEDLEDGPFKIVLSDDPPGAKAFIRDLFGPQQTYLVDPNAPVSNS